MLPTPRLVLAAAAAVAPVPPLLTEIVGNLDSGMLGSWLTATIPDNWLKLLTLEAFTMAATLAGAIALSVDVVSPTAASLSIPVMFSVPNGAGEGAVHVKAAS